MPPWHLPSWLAWSPLEACHSTSRGGPPEQACQPVTSLYPTSLGSCFPLLLLTSKPTERRFICSDLFLLFVL